MVGGVLFDDPCLPDGWTRKCIQRNSGQWDVCVYNPMGKKFQSQDEVRKYLKNIGSELNYEAFSFNPYSHSEPANSSVSMKSNRKRKSTAKENIDTTKKQKPKSKQENRNKTMRLKFDFAKQRTKQQDGKSGATPNGWCPPKSPYNLLQESCWDDPWKLLLSTILLSRAFYIDDLKTVEDDVDGEQFLLPEEKMKLAASTLETLVKRWSEPTKMVEADVKDVSSMLKDLGDEDRLAESLVHFSGDYLLKNWEYPLQLRGISRLGDESYRLFCLGDWKNLRPQNVMLRLYHNWILTNYAELNLS